MKMMLAIPESKVERVTIDGIPCVRFVAEIPMEDLLLDLACSMDGSESAVVEVEEGEE